METTSLKQFIKHTRLNPYFTLGLVLAVFISLVAVLTILFSQDAKEIAFETPTPTPEPTSQVVTQLPATIELLETDGQLIPAGLPVTYEVQPGDSSWKIALAFYGNGHNYVDIEEANQLAPDAHLRVGQQLVIPAKALRNAEQVVQSTPLPEQTSEQIEPTEKVDQVNESTSSYTVQPGDSLWTIAEDRLNDPYRWVEIYELNQKQIGANPDLIYPDTELRLPSYSD